MTELRKAVLSYWKNQWPMPHIWKRYDLYYEIDGNCIKWTEFSTDQEASKGRGLRRHCGKVLSSRKLLHKINNFNKFLPFCKFLKTYPKAFFSAFLGNRLLPKAFSAFLFGTKIKFKISLVMFFYSIFNLYHFLYY